MSHLSYGRPVITIVTTALSYVIIVIIFVISQEEAKARALGPNVPIPIKQRVLLLGSGFTVAPCVEYLTKDKSVAITIGETCI